MNITKATILVNGSGADVVFLQTDKPSPFPPSVSSEPLSFKFDVGAGGGLEYVITNFDFGIPIEVIDLKTGRITCV